MTIAATPKVRYSVPDGAAPSATSIWGLDAGQLHDLYWAARGIQIVRPGEPPDPRGPSIYLLLKSDQAVLALALPWLKRMNWLGCSILSIRITDRSRSEYQERVISGANGDFLRIERSYPDRKGIVDRVVLTTDARVSKLWAALDPGRERWRLIRENRRRGSSSAWKSDGRLFDLSQPGRHSDLLNALVEDWHEPGRVIPGIYRWSEGVWIHESSRIASSARVVGPAWIGVHSEIRDHTTMIGPVVAGDSRASVTTPVCDWEALRLPNFPLIPRVRSGLSRRVTKRAFDIAMSLFVLAATLPLYPLICAAIYLEDGRPFFFSHRRQTLGGMEFPCWKFRTMIKNADVLKAELQRQNMCDGPQFFIKHDPRLLRAGRWLRRFQLDELPQFWNVLLGQMSVVGPRPSPDNENQYCPAWREARLSVRPGVTGLWQVRRTRLPETDFQEWIRYDLEYVQHQSWRLDIWIIAKTFQKIFRG